MDLEGLSLNETAESKYDVYREILKELKVFNVIEDYESHNKDVYVKKSDYIMAKRLVEMMENAICFIQSAHDLCSLKGKYEYLDKKIDVLMDYYKKNEIEDFELLNKENKSMKRG